MNEMLPALSKENIKLAKAASIDMLLNAMSIVAVRSDDVPILHYINVVDLTSPEASNLTTQEFCFTLVCYTCKGQRVEVGFYNEDARTVHAIVRAAFDSADTDVLAFRFHGPFIGKQAKFRVVKGAPHFHIFCGGKLEVRDLPHPVDEEDALEYAELEHGVKLKLMDWTRFPLGIDLGEFLYQKFPRNVGSLKRRRLDLEFL